ncbi:MAG: ABC transporter ATP-binding protein/permease [Clostridia bacterium]|nr:ABC transporter ATP-binding protein/permease [Clostridia bacterium]
MSKHGAMKAGNGQNFKAKNPAKTFKRIMSYLKPYKVRLVFAVICMLANVVCNVGGTFMLSIVIDSFIMPLVNGETVTLGALSGLGALGGIVGIMAAIYVTGALLHYIFNYIVVVITTQILQNVRNEMFEKMQTLPIKFFDTHTHGDLMSLFTNDTDTLREFLSSSVPNLISNVLTVLGIFIMMLVLSPLLTLFTVVMLVVMLFIVKYIGGKSGKHFVRQQKEIGSLNGYIEEHIDGLKVVKVFCHENAEKAEFDNHNETLCGASKKAHTYANVLMPIMGNLSYINYAGTAIIGTILAINGFGGMTWGGLVSFLQYSRQFSNPISQMANLINGILMALAGAERIFDLIDQQPEVNEGYVNLVNAKELEDGSVVECDEYTGVWAWKHYHRLTDTTTFAKWQGEVQFEDVTFGYKPEKDILKNINLVAKPGQKIALVGSTGAGKTTITNLINRFYDIEKGKIRYDNINIKKINKEDLRHSIACVLQDTHLFTGTVRDNIRFGKLDATDEEVEQAAILANADSFIRHLPEGYDTMLTGDGANLSQGQRQLLAIARAAVANPPVLILDEATSSIDTRTEKLIEQGMDSLMKGRTVFVIAHRLSTVRNADMILVLEHGEIIERGNHDELIAQKGRYYSLYTGAFELD